WDRRPERRVRSAGPLRRRSPRPRRAPRHRRGLGVDLPLHRTAGTARFQRARGAPHGAAASPHRRSERNPRLSSITFGSTNALHTRLVTLSKTVQTDAIKAKLIEMARKLPAL